MWRISRVKCSIPQVAVVNSNDGNTLLNPHGHLHVPCLRHQLLYGSCPLVSSCCTPADVECSGRFRNTLTCSTSPALTATSYRSSCPWSPIAPSTVQRCTINCLDALRCVCHSSRRGAHLKDPILLHHRLQMPDAALLKARSCCPEFTTGFPWQPIIPSFASRVPALFGTQLPHHFDHRQRRTTVKSKRDSLSCVTLQTDDLWCKTHLTTPPKPSSSPTTIHPSLLLARPSAESAQHVSCALFRRCLPMLALVPLPPAVVYIVLVRTVLGPMAWLSALQADVLVGLSLDFALAILATFAHGIRSLALASVLPAVLRKVTESPVWHSLSPCCCNTSISIGTVFVSVAPRCIW